LPEEILFYLTVVFAVIAVASIILFLIERERRRKTLTEHTGSPQKSSLPEKILPIAISRTVSDETVKEVKDRLRVLDLEREILSYAIRRLYEAHAEGKITAEERDSLALKYREDLERIRQEIARGESIIALSELEKMQEEFIRMFSEKFETLSKRIEELKSIAGLVTPEQIPKPKEAEAITPAPHAEKTVQPKKKREAAKLKTTAEQTIVEAEGREKSEAEKRIEQIMAEIEKVLSRLSQMEVEE